MELIGIVGFSLATFAYFVFFLLLLVIKEKSFTTYIIILCSILTLSGSAIAAMQIEWLLPLKSVLVIENIKLYGWVMLFMVAQYGTMSLKSMYFHPKMQKYTAVFISLSVLCWFFSYWQETGGKFLFLLFLVLNLWAIVLFEQLYRNSDAKAKWALWPLIIALGMITVVDFIIYAQAAMLDQLDFNYWFARGYVIALGMPFFLISARRMKNWHIDVFISREIVFYSSMLMIAGSYLLVLSLAGYVINFIGGKWGEVVSVIFFVLGLGLLATLLMTEKLRREVKVFITKHFYANKYDYRHEWLKSIEQLEISDRQEFYQTATEIICSSMGTHKGALLKRLANGSYKLVYEKDFHIDGTQLSHLKVVDEFWAQHGWIIDVREYEFIENSYPELNLDLAFCRQANIDLIVPVIAKQGVYGLFLLSIDNKKSLLNWEDRDLLFAITKQLSNYLSLNEANLKLAESKQFEAFHRMSAFLVHDLKNVQAQLALINSNAEKHRDNPAFIDDVFDTVSSASERLDKVLTQLRNKQASEIVKPKKSIDVILKQVVNQRNVDKPHVSLEVDNILVAHVNEELSSVLNHLIQNAQEATSLDGWVKVKASQEDGMLHLAVVDNGCGMSEEFIKQRLFKPFDTTKGNAGMGIGVYEAKQFVESLGGSIYVTSFENEGSIFKLSIPC